MEKIISRKQDLGSGLMETDPIVAAAPLAMTERVCTGRTASSYSNTLTEIREMPLERLGGCRGLNLDGS